jgi:hypothetical protein
MRCPVPGRGFARGRGWERVPEPRSPVDRCSTWVRTAVTGSPVHYGEIRTNGIVCGSSDRTLLDFLSIGVDCGGFAHIAFAGNSKAEEAADFTNGGANVHVVNQIGGSAIAPPATCSAKRTR